MSQYNIKEQNYTIETSQIIKKKMSKINQEKNFKSCKLVQFNF